MSNKPRDFGTGNRDVEWSDGVIGFARQSLSRIVARSLPNASSKFLGIREHPPLIESAVPAPTA